MNLAFGAGGYQCLRSGCFRLLQSTDLDLLGVGPAAQPAARTAAESPFSVPRHIMELDTRQRIDDIPGFLEHAGQPAEPAWIMERHPFLDFFERQVRHFLGKIFRNVIYIETEFTELFGILVFQRMVTFSAGSDDLTSPRPLDFFQIDPREFFESRNISTPEEIVTAAPNFVCRKVRYTKAC